MITEEVGKVAEEVQQIEEEKVEVMDFNKRDSMGRKDLDCVGGGCRGRGGGSPWTSAFSIWTIAT